MILTKRQIRDLYRKRAKNYDFTANLYYLMGFREWNFRKRAIEALKLKQGDIVLEIGCGTGLNFPFIQKAIGPEGKIIGIDLTDGMLEMAANRIRNNNWQNVELIHGDAAAIELPPGINKALSIFAITLIPEFDAVIGKIARALPDGGRMAVLDFKKPSDMPLWLLKFAVFLTKLFGVSLELGERRPWESIEMYFKNIWIKDLYWGFCYIAVGENPLGKVNKATSTNLDVKSSTGRS